MPYSHKKAGDDHRLDFDDCVWPLAASNESGAQGTRSEEESVPRHGQKRQERF